MLSRDKNGLTVTVRPPLRSLRWALRDQWRTTAFRLGRASTASFVLRGFFGFGFACWLLACPFTDCYFAGFWMTLACVSWSIAVAVLAVRCTGRKISK